MTSHITLNRTLSLPMMVLYGLGTTIGAGIYALMGEITRVAGYFAPLSFLFAALLAGFTALSFAELCGRYPYAAGASLYVKQGFSSKRLSSLIGILVVAAGLVSAAALLNGFVSYLHQFTGIDRNIAILLAVLVLGGITAWGIAQSVFLASLITVVEIGGLLLVIAVSNDALSDLPSRWTELIPSADISSWNGIYLGAILSFYAFIGFEDMVDVAEEVKDVKRNLPKAIILTLAITTIIYLLLMTSAVLSLPPAELASSQTPLIYLYEYHTGEKTVVIGVIGMFAIINGALIQMIMASRVLYGMSSRGQLPRQLAVVHVRTQTPLYATVVVTGIVLILALAGGLASLAEITSMIMLIVFSLVNLALWRIKQRIPKPDGVRVFPSWMPITGFFISSAFVLSAIVNLINKY
jgi:APA family basic amino acid/polyamine antiporter